MTTYRTDPPPDELRDLIEYRDGELFFQEHALKDKRRKNKAIGSTKADGYKETALTANGEKRKYYVHRLIYWLKTGDWPQVIDHIDRNRANNSFENLRGCTQLENNRNKPYRKGVSDYIGVSAYHKNKYRINITLNNKQYFIHGYETPEAAALARDLLARLLYGPHMDLNLLNFQNLKVNGVAV